MSFEPRFTVTNAITADLTRIERVRGFLEAATLSEEWIRRMGARAFVLEAHHTTHIEGIKLSLEESERLLAGEAVPDADPEDIRELLNYRDAFEFVSTCSVAADRSPKGWSARFTSTWSRASVAGLPPQGRIAVFRTTS